MGPFTNCFRRQHILGEPLAADETNESETKPGSEKGCPHQAGWEKNDDETPTWDVPSCPFKHGTVKVTPYPGG